MHEVTFRNRRAVSIENEHLRVTVLVEGGHVAEILDKASGVNPLWLPPWPSIEPSTYSRAKHPEYGDDAESKLLAGIMGHNLCLDLFGPPTAEEAAAGMTVHGEASIVPYEITASGQDLTASAVFPIARLRFERKLRLQGRRVLFSETLENLAPVDYPIAWTQHVTLGPPFVERGVTTFRAPVTRSYSLGANREFSWPHAPEGDLRTYNSSPVSSNFTTHLMDPAQGRAYFLAHSSSSNLLIGYEWERTDFPWLGVWEENHSRRHAPWNGQALTWGMEFGASPLPESRRAMIERNGMLGGQGYRWVPARSFVTVRYSAFTAAAASIPERLEELKVGISA